MRRTADALLELRYALEGDIARVIIPAETTPRRADNLWQHTCFEAFVAVEGRTGYCELNFSPSRQWAIYRFNAYREGMTTVESPPPHVAVRHETDRLHLHAVVDLEPLFVESNGLGLRLALSAVVEENDHRLSYWALTHPSGQADFHHVDSFTLALPGDATPHK